MHEIATRSQVRASRSASSLRRHLFTCFFFPLQKTATPFPQRWGLLRKGRAVFRREDLRFEKLIV
jgi:hypothetical protein